MTYKTSNKKDGRKNKRAVERRNTKNKKGKRTSCYHKNTGMILLYRRNNYAKTRSYKIYKRMIYPPKNK